MISWEQSAETTKQKKSEGFKKKNWRWKNQNSNKQRKMKKWSKGRSEVSLSGASVGAVAISDIATSAVGHGDTGEGVEDVPEDGE